MENAGLEIIGTILKGVENIGPNSYESQHIFVMSHVMHVKTFNITKNSRKACIKLRLA